MVWLEKADAQALSGHTNVWNQIRDGRKPSELPRPTFGFRVTKPFTSPKLKSRFLPGMQGQVLHCEGSGAYVQVRDLFDADGQPLKDWISRDFIEIGTTVYGTWEIDVCQVPRTSSKLTPKELDLLNDPSCKHLALAISTFLLTLAKTNPEALTSETLDRLGGPSGSKVPWITARVIEGVKQARLLSVLNNPSFTIKELVEKAVLDCSSSTARSKSGFYLRRYIEPNPGKSKKHCSLYIGQAADLNNRYSTWVQGGHEELKKRSESITMRAICLVQRVFYDDHKYIVEQLFTSLLQTYQGALFDKTRTVDLGDAQGNYHVKHCYDMNKIATAAAKESGWTGGVLRKSFWEGSFATCAGLNYQTPLAEAPKYEQSVWLRTDGYMPDMENAGKSIPISNFTREVPKKMTVVTPSAKSSSQDKFFIVFSLVSDNKDYAMRISRTLSNDPTKDGMDWPAKDTYYNLTFEVRTDWKPHPFSWARLPLVGPFEDWDRANSWALSANWIDPSGQHRSKYLHCERPHKMMNTDSDGSIQAYARGIEVRVSHACSLVMGWRIQCRLNLHIHILTFVMQIIHWLYNERIPADKQHRWLQVVPMASVKAIKHDHVRQKVTFEAAKPVTTTAPISSLRKHPDVIRDEMEGRGIHGDMGLANVGLTMPEARQATTEKFGNRRKCDTCMFFGRNTGLTQSCVPNENKVCENCRRIFGRPCCSWSPGIPAVSHGAGSRGTGPGNSFDDLDAIGDTANVLRRTALFGLRGWPGDVLVSADPAVLEVDQGSEIDDTELEAAEAAGGHDGGWLGPSTASK
jgi:hypothetical protein